MITPDPSSQPTRPVEGSPAAPIPSSDLVNRRPGGIITVMHPEGIIPYAAEGLSLDKPLFARVTYRPTSEPGK